MAKVRVDRVGEQIKKEVSSLIQYELKDPRVGFVTVTGVELNGDLSQATIYISVMGSDEEINSSLDAIEKAKGFLRKELSKKIRLFQVPELFFKLDQSIAYGDKIEKLLKDIKDQDES